MKGSGGRWLRAATPACHGGRLTGMGLIAALRAPLLLAWMVVAAGMALAQPAGTPSAGPSGSAASAAASRVSAPPAAAASEAAATGLTVATRVLPPFVIQEGDRLGGFSAELWELLARELGVKQTWKTAGNVKELLETVERGDAHLGIAAISITRERAERFEFSQPMFESGLQILVPKQGDNRSGLKRLLDFVSSDAMLVVLGVLGLFILVPGHIAWFLERGHPGSDIDRAYFPGIFQAMAWATGAFVGQQSNHLQTLMGRFMSLFAIICSVFFLTYVQATLTTDMTVEQLRGGIQGPDDLPGKRVGTTTGSTASAWLKAHSIQPTEFQRIADAFGALERAQLDAVVFDAPVLLYHAKHQGGGKVEVVGPIFKKENYGIVFPPGSPWRQPVNAALLKLREEGAYDELMRRWFGQR